MIKDKEAKNLGTLCVLLVAGLLVSQQLLGKKKGKKKGKTERGGKKKRIESFKTLRIMALVKRKT